MLAAIAVVDVLHHDLAPLVLEIDIDVGRLFAVLRDEALEQQVVVNGVDLGDAEGEAERGMAAEPRPWHRISCERANLTMSCTVRK